MSSYKDFDVEKATDIHEETNMVKYWFVMTLLCIYLGCVWYFAFNKQLAFVNNAVSQDVVIESAESSFPE